MRIAYDTETRGLRWAYEDQRAFLGTWADEATERYAALVGERRGEAAQFLAALGRADTVTAHNQKFDAHQVRETLGFDIFETDKELHDTDLMSRVLLPEGQREDRGGHGLKNLAESPVGLNRSDAKEYEDKIKERAKEIGLRTLAQQDAYYKVWCAFAEDMERYALFDARYTYDLHDLFMPQLEADPTAMKLYDLERDVQRVLYKAERRGTMVDPPAVARLKAEYTSRRQEAAMDCEKYLGFVPEGEGSEEQLIEAIEMAGIDLVETTPSGQKAVNRKALAKFADEPPIAALFAFRRWTHFLNTYIGPLEGVDVVHPDFQQAEAWTGRMSCRNPNMQNLPKRADLDEDNDDRVRRVFIPRPQHYFVVADFEAIEPRILAYYLGIPEYRQIVDQGLTYEHVASVAWGGKPEDYKKGTGPRAFLRPAAKQILLSISYGAGAPRVQETINEWAPAEYHVDRDGAKSIRSKVTAGIPGFYSLAGRNGRIQEQVRDAGYVRTLGGRRQLVKKDKAYVGLNALIQGSAADIMKMAAVNLDQLEGHPLLFVHDEVVMEYPNDYDPARALQEVTEAMESAFDLDPPLRIEASVTDKSYAHA